jgi:hypothetical protein
MKKCFNVKVFQCGKEGGGRERSREGSRREERGGGG